MGVAQLEVLSEDPLSVHLEGLTAQIRYSVPVPLWPDKDVA